MSSVLMSPTSSLSSTTSTSAYYPSVSRSDELLSCAKTFVKMTQRQHAHDPVSSDGSAAAGWWTHYCPADMHLHPMDHVSASVSGSTSSSTLEDGLGLLRTMNVELKQLESLVRRRGQTNDPTQEISLAVKRLDADTKELATLIQTMIPPTARGQWLKHWETLQQWFQSVAQKQGDRLKEILKVRGKVLEDQQQRRKRFQASAQSQTTKAAYQDNPLFQIPKVQTPVTNRTGGNGAPVALTPAASVAGGQQTARMNGTRPAPPAMSRPPHSSTASSYYASNNNNNNNTSTPYSGSTSSAAGYGGAAATSSYYGQRPQATTGMRLRRVAGQVDYNHNSQQQQQQQDSHTQFLLQQQQEQRATQQRLQEARHAERSLAELGTLFGKMSTLITQQSEVMSNIEDDVEAACLDVTAGHAEITTLYSIKKGNRALILKVFGLLIFFIVFMRLYAKK